MLFVLQILSSLCNSTVCGAGFNKGEEDTDSAFQNLVVQRGWQLKPVQFNVLCEFVQEGDYLWGRAGEGRGDNGRKGGSYTGGDLSLSWFWEVEC